MPYSYPILHSVFPSEVKNDVYISPWELSSMLERLIMYRHPHQCLSRNIPHPGSQGVFHQDYSYLGFPVLKEYRSSTTTLIFDALIHPQRASNARCLPNPPLCILKWRQEWCVYLSLLIREDISIPIKECTHSYGRNVPKLPIGLGISKFLSSKKLVSKLPLN